MPKESIVQGTFGTAGDVWAAGLVMAELFTHQAPFASCDTQVKAYGHIVMRRFLSYRRPYRTDAYVFRPFRKCA